MRATPETGTERGPGADERSTRRDLLFGGALLAGLLTQNGCVTPMDAEIGGDDSRADTAREPWHNAAASGAAGANLKDLLPHARRMAELDAPPVRAAFDKLRAQRAELQAAASDVPTGDVDAVMREPLLARTTYGTTQLDRSLYSIYGYEGWLERQLDPESIDDSATDALLAGLPTIWMSAEESYALDDFSLPIYELLAARTIRAMYSQRQLFERMVEFWTDHFNISILDGLGNVFKPVDDRDVIRRHALGTFPELLEASAKSPAMLWYLDNYLSFAGAINENYSRELLELHTMGVDGGYTQQDVEEVARCFTGWTINGTAGSWGTFVFIPDLHDFGEKAVLGNVIPAGQRRRDGLMVLKILAAHPSTARFISTKMTRWLWGYEPPQRLIDEVTQTYLDTGGDIKSMIRVILSPQWLLKATPKLKRPYHYLMSIGRVTEPSFSDLLSMSYWADVMGHLPYFWPAPNGYSDALGYWSGHLLPRWNMPAALASDTSYGMLMDPADLVGAATEADDVVAQLNLKLHGGAMPDAEQDALRAFLVPNPPNPPRPQRIRDAIGLAFAAPSFQWY